MTAQPAWLRFRRMLGLFAFFYAALHLLCYSAFDMEFVLADIVQDVLKRPFITLGMATFVILLALAVTSNRASIRRLGKRWTKLHQLVYVATITGLVHFWLVRKVVAEELLVLMLTCAVLLGFRLWWTARQSRALAAA